METGRLDDAIAAGPRLGGAVAAALEVAPAAGGSDLGYQIALLRLRHALDQRDRAEGRAWLRYSLVRCKRAVMPMER